MVSNYDYINMNMEVIDELYRRGVISSAVKTKIRLTKKFISMSGNKKYRYNEIAAIEGMSPSHVRHCITEMLNG